MGNDDKLKDLGGWMSAKLAHAYFRDIDAEDWACARIQSWREMGIQAQPGIVRTGSGLFTVCVVFPDGTAETPPGLEPQDIASEIEARKCLIAVTNPHESIHDLEFSPQDMFWPVRLEIKATTGHEDINPEIELVEFMIGTRCLEYQDALERTRWIARNIKLTEKVPSHDEKRGMVYRVDFPQRDRAAGGPGISFLARLKVGPVPNGLHLSMWGFLRGRVPYMGRNRLDHPQNKKLEKAWPFGSGLDPVSDES